MLSSSMSFRSPHNMVNFGPLTAEIGSGAWGTPVNFNGFRVLAALLHGSQVSSEHQRNFVALNRGRHLCSAGRPSRWALAHILVFVFFYEYHLITGQQQHSNTNGVSVCSADVDNQCLSPHLGCR